ncbi:MAG: formylglycine-generating enzyme family protein, partial [Thermoguttaceae bacterium]|nr:formylglycine-generating enzyme family protein [Thermoguttaceae bacterium]
KGDRRGGRGIRGGAWNRSSVSSFGRSHCAQYHCDPTVGFRVAVGSWDAESAAAISEPLDEAAVAAVVASIRTARENAPPADALDANSDAAWDSEPPAGTRKTFDVGGVEFAFRYCPPGTFIEGETSERGYENPGDRRIATLTSGFWIAETPTTRAQFQATNAKPKRIRSGFDPPVSDASWFAAVEFCESLNALNIAPTGFAFRLPTSAEWEFACRAWTLGPFNVDGAAPEELGWFAENSKVGKTRAPQAVRQKRPNAWGLFDMHGNVAEWTSDVSAWRDSSAPVVDPTGSEPEPEPEPKPASKRESERFGCNGLAKPCASGASYAAAVTNSALGRASPVGKTKPPRLTGTVSASFWRADAKRRPPPLLKRRPPPKSSKRTRQGLNATPYKRR